MKKLRYKTLFIYTLFVVFGFLTIYSIASAFTPPSGPPPNTEPTNTIGVSRGGTGLTSAGALNNVLTSNGTTWVSSTPAAVGVGGGGTTNYISKFTASGTIGNSQIFDDGTSLGIGTSTDFGGYKVSIVGDNYNTAGIRQKSSNDTNYAGPHVTLMRSRGTPAAPTAMIADDTAGRLFYYGYDGTAYDQLGYIDMRADAITAGVVSGKIVLATSDTTGSIVNALTIDDGQNVGIGQNIMPMYRTDVAVSSSGTYLTTTNPAWTALRLRNINTTDNTAVAIRFANTSNNDATNQYSSYIAGVRTSLPAAGSQALAFGTSNGGVAPVERMRIDPSGNVGIGTTTPASKLHVVGPNTTGSSNTEVMRLYTQAAPNQNYADNAFHLSFVDDAEGGGFAAESIRISSRREGNWVSAAAQSAGFEFWTRNANVLDKKMVIKANGNVGIGTASPLELLSLGTAGTTKGVLSLAGNTSGKIVIQPAAAAGTYTLTLPTAQGAASTNLQNDGAGNLSWAVAASTSFRTNGTVTRDLTTPYATLQVIPHGLGKIPTKVKMSMTYPSSSPIDSFGAYDSGGQNCTYHFYYTAPRAGTWAGRIIGTQFNTSDSISAVLSVDATNLTLTWIGNGNPSGTAYILWEAEYN